MKGPILVTGATGFVGGKLAHRLLSSGYGVRVLARSAEKAREFVERGADLVEGDLRDVGVLKRAVQGVGTVYHIAAIFRQARFNEQELREVNASAVRHLMEASMTEGVHRFIHCSTVGVLGDIKNRPADENTPYAPGDAYQRTKMEGEQIAIEILGSGNLRGIVIRPAMIYGPGDLRLLKLFKPIAQGSFIMVGSGQTLAHFVYIDDLVQGFLLAGEKEEITNRIYILSGPEEITLWSLAELIAEQAGSPPPRWRLPLKPVQWAGDLCERICRPLGIEPPLYRRRVDFFAKNRSFSSAKAQRELGYAPQVSMREGVKRTLSFYKEKGYIPS